MCSIRSRVVFYREWLASPLPVRLSDSKRTVAMVTGSRFVKSVGFPEALGSKLAPGSILRFPGVPTLTQDRITLSLPVHSVLAL